MRQKIGHFLMYVIAALFLGYHLMPVFTWAQSQISRSYSKDAKKQAIVDNATCTSRDSTYLTLTGASPLDTLYREIPYARPESRALNGVNLITNPSFASGKDGWETNGFGENSVTFSLTDGYDGTSAARVVMRDRKSGDGKWLSQAISVRPAEYVVVEHWFRSDTYTDVIADVTQADGEHIYIQLGKGEPTNNQWRKLRYEMVVPPNAQSLSIGHALTENGTLDVDAWKLVKSDASPLKRGLVSMTFDDGWESIYTNGLPLFRKYNVKTTQFVVSDVIGDGAYLKPDQLRQFEREGHDIGSHSALHEDLSVIGVENVRTSLATSRAVLNEYYGMSAFDFAAPYGRTNVQSQALIRDCYRSHRGTDTGYNSALLDRYNLKVFNVELTTKPEEIASAIRFARDNKLWLILVYHEVGDESGSSYAANTKDLERTLQILQEESVPVVTISQGLQETLPQVEAQEATSPNSVVFQR